MRTGCYSRLAGHENGDWVACLEGGGYDGYDGTRHLDMLIWARGAGGDGGGATRGSGDGGGCGYIGGRDGQGACVRTTPCLPKLLHTSGLDMCVGRRVPRLGSG